MNEDFSCNRYSHIAIIINSVKNTFIQYVTEISGSPKLKKTL